MATQWTAGTTSGQVLTAATLNTIGAAWESWTPVWTASTTNPVIGNGFIVGTYCRINKIVIAEGYVIAGSTTTFGTGTYRISVPISPMISTNALVGYATILDASAGYISYSGVASQASTTLVEFRLGAASNLFAPTVPVTMANADQFRFQLIYQAA
jgi:heptaprenylglyceryl phosphate synthase